MGSPTVLILRRQSHPEVLRKQQIVVDIDMLSRLPGPTQRAAICRLLAIEETNPSVGYTCDGIQLRGNLFDSACERLRRSQGDDRHRSLTLICNVIAQRFDNAENRRLACSDVSEILNRVGVRFTANQLFHSVSDAVALAAQGGDDGDTEATFVAATWDDTGDDLMVPSGWTLEVNAIIAADGSTFVGQVYISKILRDIEGEAYFVEIRWWRAGRWYSRVVPKEMVATSRGIVELANYGINVTSNNAAILVDFLNDFENKNIEVIPTTQIANRLGWIQQGEQNIFLLGTDCVIPTAAESENFTVQFRGGDDGDDQTASSLRQSGTADAWYRAISRVRHLDRVMLGIYASIGASVLRIVSNPNFVVSYDGRTSVGKTSTQMIAASAWGYPIVNGASGNSYPHGWDATKVYIERTATVLNGLPLILDDTKNAVRREDVVSTVYQYAAGAGRGRGSQAGIAAKTKWQGVLISSGEEPIKGFSKDGGSRARVLGCWGSPLEGLDNAGPVIVGITQCLEENFGHIGPAFVRHLVEHQNIWEQWRLWYREARQRYQQRAGTNVVAGRMASHFAVLELTAMLAHQTVFNCWEYSNTISNLWPELTLGTNEADQGLAALNYIISWANSNRGRFVARRGHESPSNGWLGKWSLESRSDNSEEALAIYPHALRKALDDEGYAYAAIIRLWKDSGWLRTEEDKTTIRVSIEGQSSAMVAIRRSVIDDLMSGAEEPVPSF